MPGSFAFLGLSTLGYNDYRDTETGLMLIAEPGESYDIAAIDGVAPVPPADGRWDPPYVPPAPVATPEGGGGEPAGGQETASAPPGPEPPPAVPSVPPVPPLEGGE